MSEAQGGTPTPTGTPAETAATALTATTEATQAPATAAATTKAPAATTEAPATTTEAPAATTEAPATTTEAEGQPKDWAELRAKYAGEDEKVAKRLSRYSSVEAALDALVAAQDKIASGTMKGALPKDATPEQLKAWREENGVPDAPEGYKLQLGEGVALGDADKPVVEEFLKAAHAKNMTPEQASGAVSWYLAEQERQLAERHTEDARITAKATAAMKQEWGSEYDLNKNLILNYLDTAPAGVKDQIMSARLGDGTPFASHPDVLRFLANTAREINPVATVAPGSGANAMQAIESEKASIESMMGDKASAYWKGEQSVKLQARYRDIITTLEKVRVR